MNEYVPRLKVKISKNQRKHLREVISNSNLITGPHQKELEGRLKNLFNKNYILLTSNGFSSIMAALSMFPKAQPVSTVAVSTCFAIPNAIMAQGRSPLYRDIDFESLSLDKQYPGINVIPNHFGKVSSAIKYDKKNKSVVIEDAAQSFHSSKNKSTNSDVLILSFYPTKFVNGVDGGALLTDDIGLFEAASYLLNYDGQRKSEPGFKFNFRLNNLNAAMALGALEDSVEIEERLLGAHFILEKCAKEAGLHTIDYEPHEVPTRFVIFCKSSEKSRQKKERLISMGLDAQSEFLNLTSKDPDGLFPVGSQLSKSLFSIPFHPYLNKKELLIISEALKAI